jgi:hypothetical protein
MSANAECPPPNAQCRVMGRRCGAAARTRGLRYDVAMSVARVGAVDVSIVPASRSPCSSWYSHEYWTSVKFETVVLSYVCAKPAEVRD